nr:transglycosylase domain-containing protein [Paracoccus sp. (in: a-proteobacteria)]
MLAAGAGDGLRAGFEAWVDATALPPLAVSTGVEVLARDGSLLRAFPVGNGLWRLAPPQSGVDPRFLAMLVAWEDRRFATHNGVDARAVLRAGWQALRHGRVVSGASTLSMQADWGAKLRQARVALALERRLGKGGVLDLYLRLAPYGGNTEGVRAASLMWFGREPDRLTPGQAALLVALPQSPETRRPDLPAGRA